MEAGELVLLNKDRIHDPKAKLSLAGLLVINMAGFYLIYDLTVPPNTISGNGNPVLLLMVPVTVIFIALNVFLGIKVNHFLQRQSKLTTMLIITAMVAVFLVLLSAEITFVNHLMDQLGGRPDNPNLKIYGWGWLNQYTNSLYFNQYTFTMGLAVSVSLGAAVALLQTKKSNCAWAVTPGNLRAHETTHH